MGFDRFACARYEIRSAGPWVDTSELARRAGLPGALDALGQRWLGLEKDAAASRFTVGLSTVRRPGKRYGDACIDADEWRAMSDDERRERGVQAEYDEAARERVEAYCRSDVAIMVHGWPRLAEWLDVDADVSRVDRIVNDRGVCFDQELARALLDADARLAAREVDAVAREVGVSTAAVREAARSPAHFCALTGAPNAQKATVDDMTHPLARARRALASIARGKLRAGLALVSDDGRLRDSQRYYGAHTGRWSGKGMQLQNLPRPDDEYEDWSHELLAHVADAVTSHALAPGGHDLINVLLRATLTASPGNTLVVCDFSSVEARATAWAAGDRAAVDVFRSGADPYLVAASRIYGREITGKGHERTVGKMAELACGYGGGPGAYEKFARTMSVDISDLDTRAIVTAWRELHAPIVQLWRDLERAFKRAISDGRSSWVSCFEVVPGASDVAIFLPSGRPIVYREARLVTDGTWADGSPRTSIRFVGTRGPEYTYGGKLTENVIQAMCRDLMADALVRAEAAGLCPVMHVHDEIVCDVPASAGQDAFGELRLIMTTPPAWAAGFPVGADGFVARRYRK
jgi:DNA polymerase